MTASVPPLTDHARTRVRQRGLREGDVQQVRDFGTPYHAGKGCTAFLVDKGAMELARKQGIELARLYGVACIESADGAIVTVARYRKKPHQWQ